MRRGILIALGSLALLTAASPASAQTVAPTSLTFPPTEFRQESPPQPVTLTNTSLSSFQVFPITYSTPPAAGSFYQTHNCPSFLGAGQSCTINVTMVPIDPPPFAKSGILDVANGSGPTVALTGSGVYAKGKKKKCKKGKKGAAAAKKKKCKKK